MVISSAMYDQIGCRADDREIFTPPTTHLVATVEDLINTLDYGSDKATDMDEDVGDNSGAELVAAIPHTGK